MNELEMVEASKITLASSKDSYATTHKHKQFASNQKWRSSDQSNEIQPQMTKLKATKRGGMYFSRIQT
jgi:hypothetical protein